LRDGNADSKMKSLLPYRNKFHYSFIFGLFVIILCILSCGPSGDPDASGVRTPESLTQIPLPEKYSNQQGKLPLGEKDENKASQGIVEKQNRAQLEMKKVVDAKQLKSNDTNPDGNAVHRKVGDNDEKVNSKLPAIPINAYTPTSTPLKEIDSKKSEAASENSSRIVSNTPNPSSQKSLTISPTPSIQNPVVEATPFILSSDLINDFNGPEKTSDKNFPKPDPKAEITPTPVKGFSGAITHTPNPTKTPIMFKGYSGSPTPVFGGKISQTETPALTFSVPTNTSIPTPTPTLLPSLIPTMTPTVTPSPTSTPTPTPTPIPWDEIYGVAVHTSAGTSEDAKYFLDQLGLKWHVDFSSSKDLVPEGSKKLQFLGVPKDQNLWNSGDIKNIENMSDDQLKNLGIFTRTELREKAANDKGAYWYLFGEPNRYGYIDADSFATLFHYYMEQLKLGDETAKIIGTSVLNWDYTCIGCGGEYDCEDEKLKGFQCGKVWFKNLITAYEGKYGHKPIVDAWGFNAYPLDWITVPNSKLHVQVAVDQISGIRGYLDTIPEYTNTPVWVTEMAVHVGYDNYTFNYQTGFFEPIGNYRWDKMSDFLIGSLDWLEKNYAPGKLEKWFFYNTWTHKVNPSAYMGIIFFDGAEPGASLNCLGQIYKYRALGQKNYECGSSGQLLELQ